jgi:hypothetical protein
MLKRRPSKRFVLAETGEETAWDTTTDNDPPQIQIDAGTTNDTSTIESDSVSDMKVNTQNLTVPQPIKSGMK